MTLEQRWIPDLSGKVAIVTGGYRGLGRAISGGLRAAGADVSIWARDVHAMDRVCEEIGAGAVRCDVRRDDDVDAAIKATVERHGRVDVLVANAGRASAYKSILDIDIASFRDIIETNLAGTFRTCQAAARQMVQQGSGGRLIAISSIRAERAAALAPAYTASKSGVEGLVRSMALGLASHGITANAVRPGWMETDMTEYVRTEKGQSAALLDKVAMARWGQPADLVGVVLYLASDASAFHTGDVLTVDGGYSAGDPSDPTTATRLSPGCEV